MTGYVDVWWVLAYDVLLCFHLPQLISDALHNKIVKWQDFISMDGHINLTSRIAAVHIVYRAVCECVHWFGQLTLHNPGILAGLVAQQIVPEEDECMVRLHYCAILKLSLSPLEWVIITSSLDSLTLYVQVQSQRSGKCLRGGEPGNNTKRGLC